MIRLSEIVNRSRQQYCFFYFLCMFNCLSVFLSSFHSFVCGFSLPGNAVGHVFTTILMFIDPCLLLTAHSLLITSVYNKPFQVVSPMVDDVLRSGCRDCFDTSVICRLHLSLPRFLPPGGVCSEVKLLINHSLSRCCQQMT